MTRSGAGRRFIIGAVVLAIIGTTALCSPAPVEPAARPQPTAPVIRGRCGATDGDSLSCLISERRTLTSGGKVVTRGGKPVTAWVPVRVNLRLNGIDAAELPGHCRKGRICAPGDPHKAKAQMAAWIKDKTLHWVPLGVDHYGRTIAQPKERNRDLSCGMLRLKLAIYKPRWDNFRAVRTACPSVAK